MKMAIEVVCILRSDLEKLIPEVKNLEDNCSEVCVYYDINEPKLILEAHDMEGECKEKTIEIRYQDHEKLLEALTEVIRIYNIEEIKNRLNRYESIIEKIKEKIEHVKNDHQSELERIPKYKKRLEELELKVKELKEQIQNPEKIEPELSLGIITDDIDEFKNFLDFINAPPNVRQLFDYYASGRFIENEERLPINVCDDAEPGDEEDEEEVDIADPYWCVKDEFWVEGYLVFLPAKKSLKILISIASHEHKELEEEITLHTINFDNAYDLLKTINDYYENDLISKTKTKFYCDPYVINKIIDEYNRERYHW